MAGGGAVFGGVSAQDSRGIHDCERDAGGWAGATGGAEFGIVSGGDDGAWGAGDQSAAELGAAGIAAFGGRDDLCCGDGPGAGGESGAGDSDGVGFFCGGGGVLFASAAWALSVPEWQLVASGCRRSRVTVAGVGEGRSGGAGGGSGDRDDVGFGGAVDWAPVLMRSPQAVVKVGDRTAMVRRIGEFCCDLRRGVEGGDVGVTRRGELRGWCGLWFYGWLAVVFGVVMVRVKVLVVAPGGM